MLGTSSEIWKKEVEDYEARMFDYFAQCSTRLRQWYENGGEHSEAYRLEYKRLSDEYQKYIEYIQQLRELVGNPSATSEFQPADTPLNKLTEEVTTSEAASVALSEPASALSSSYTTAAACYTQYYREMISYFDKLLASIESCKQAETSSDEDVPTSEAKKENEVESTAPSRTMNGEVHDAHSEEPPTDMCCDPRVMMEQYFERYGEAGKWDWASWNNYLSWIARTYPQWYGIFMEYSQSLGIDWDEMYKCWKLSDPVVSNGPTVETLSLQSGAHPQQNINRSGLFNSFSEQNGWVDDSWGNSLFCQTCKQQFSSDRVFRLHFRGVTHIQRALQDVQKQHPEHFDGWVQPRLPEMTPEERHHVWLQSQYLQYNQSEFLLSGSFYCELCKVNSSSHASLQSHLNGRRHRENVAIMQRTGDVTQLKEKRPMPVKTTARLQTLLDMCTQPLIGLNYIVERQFGDDEDCVYICELCDEKIVRQQAIKHVCDIPHRVNYMRIHYPELCTILDHDDSDLVIRKKRIDFFARKVEDFEGRKRVKVKCLSAFDALRRIWRPPPPSLEVNDQNKNIAKRGQKLKSNRKKVSSSKQPKNKLQRDTDAEENPIQKTAKASSPSEGDLEEGEITEDSSSDESGSVGEEETINPSDLEEGVVSHELSPDVSSKELEEFFPIRRLFPPHAMPHNPDPECTNYIEKLKTDGSLSLGQPSANVVEDNATTDVTQQLSAKSDCASLEEEFSREADWVLDRVRAHRADEEEQRRQLAASVSATAVVQATKQAEAERQTRMQQGLDVMEKTRMAIDSGIYDAHFIQPPVCRPTDFTTLPPLSMPAGPRPPFMPLSNPPPRPIGPHFDPHPVHPSNQTVGPMAPDRRQLAMSNGAVEVILSAIGALKNAGQLPSYLTDILNTRNQQQMQQRRREQQFQHQQQQQRIQLEDEQVLHQQQQQRFQQWEQGQRFQQHGNLHEEEQIWQEQEKRQCFQQWQQDQWFHHQQQQRIQADNRQGQQTQHQQPLHHQQSDNYDRESNRFTGLPNVTSNSFTTPAIGSSDPPSDVPPLVPVPSTTATASISTMNQKTGNLNPLTPTSIDPAVAPQISSEKTVVRTSMSPSIVTMTADPSFTNARSSSLANTGNFGHSIEPTFPPRIRDPQSDPNYASGVNTKNHPYPDRNSNPATSEPHKEVQRHQSPIRKHSRFDLDYRNMTNSSTASDLTSKVTSYIRTEQPRSSDTMFDAYALYSRHSDEHSRPQQHQRLGRGGFVRPEMRYPYQKRANATGSSQKAGRKLSVIADFLGVNEPPAPPSVSVSDAPRSPPLVSTSLSSSAFVPMSSNMSYWRAPAEPSYLIPVSTPASNLHSSTLPRISFYIPTVQTTPVQPGVLPVPPTQLSASLVPSPSCPVSQVFCSSPAPFLPSVSSKAFASLLGAPFNFSEFVRQLRGT